jgi:hypothetical protein
MSPYRERAARFNPAFYVETPSRSVYRATLTQPSQMGNFKHQSSRSNERDREHVNKERDLRDKEGQERLRNVSTIG